MGDAAAAPDPAHTPPVDQPDAGTADLSTLRALLVGPEQREIARLRARLNDARGRAEDLAEVLPQVLLQHTQDPQFTRALTPPIEKAITTSVQRNPKPLADALFPVMGPAIRKAVSAGLASMVDSLNRTLEHSLSIRSLRWRMEGWRTGRSFAEVVLTKTLVYRVEQVFLIDRTAGLLLRHVHAADLDVPDADMVSGLLTAIRDFAADSFKVASGDSLDTLQVGHLSVWIESGPSAVIAAVIRGVAPPDLRRTLQETVENIHLQFGEAFAAFNGDTAPFADAESALAACLGMEFRAEERRPRRRGAWLIFAGVLALLAVWAGLAYRAHRQWTHYLDLVRAEPGLVVVSAGRASGRYVVTGLRDPLARDPSAFVAAAGLAPGSVVERWSPYQALEPSLILARAARILRPPAGVALAFEAEVLTATGNPPLDWVREAERLAVFVPGVTRFDVAHTLAPAIAEVTRTMTARAVLFVKGSTEPAPGEDAQRQATIDDIRRLNELAGAAHLRFAVDVVGHADQDGPGEANVPLSAARAEAILAALEPDTLPHLTLKAIGVGSTEPADTGEGEESDRRNRRVVIRVIPSGGR